MVIHLDELEAIRLADYKGLYHEDAAVKMEISRATFGRILDPARYRIAEAIVNGKALRIKATINEIGESHEGRFCSSQR